jgi:hypothetical protein
MYCGGLSAEIELLTFTSIYVLMACGKDVPPSVASLLRAGNHRHSVTSASGADGSGWASSVARDKLALHSSKALWNSGVQVMGWEPLILGPERTSCSGA